MLEAEQKANKTLLFEKTSLELTLEDERCDKEIVMNFLDVVSEDLKEVEAREKKQDDLVNELQGNIRSAVADYKRA